MHFLVVPPQPAAGAAGNPSRVQLPALSGSASCGPNLRLGKTPPAPAPAGALAPRPHLGPGAHRAQHRTQCRAACMSKANF